MNYDQICEGIEKLVSEERCEAFRETEVQMRCRPPLLILSNANIEEERDEFYISLRKIVSEFLSDTDGELYAEDHAMWLNEWASEFEAQAKRMRNHAKKLEK